jgi:DNA adenine methylase
MSDLNQIISARPVLKWAGGKNQLLPELMRRTPKHFSAYHEPFVGGAALFFELSNQQRLGHTYLSDINLSLIEVYQALRDCPNEVIAVLKQHIHAEDYYYQLRAIDPKTLTLPERAARIIYLNKTCYNGLYRENRSGQFNVPFGRYKNPTICDEPNLRAAAIALGKCRLRHSHFSSVLEVAEAGDFAYFDPPYHPISTTSNFTSYAKDGFGERDQTDLRDVFAELTQRGVKVMLSNSSAPLIHELYAAYRIETVFAARMINSKAASRGKIAEVIVRNYDEEDNVLTPVRHTQKRRNKRVAIAVGT